MSSAFNLSLPTHIPWQHLSTSKDMMDSTRGDQSMPLKWKSSLSFFYYQPKVEEELYPDSEILYIKVVCSITGFQVGDELGVDLEDSKDWDTQTWENFQNLRQTYFPCYGSILQVNVTPHNNSNEPIEEMTQYPRIIDFEPKKREVFDAVTRTGEVLSRSINTIQVTKGSTSVTSSEDVNIDNGGSFSISGNVAKVGGGSIGGSHSQEVGTRLGQQNENVNIRNIDASQEQREGLSHMTQLTQMYHLLDSYHLGTNRALFAMFPRPHFGNVELSVTNGPRRLEGIQEFFLVVELPKGSKEVCFEAQLETAHRQDTERTVTEGELEYERGTITQKVEGMYDHDTTKTYPIRVPSGYKVDREKHGGYKENIREGDDQTEDIGAHYVRVFDDRIEVVVEYDPLEYFDDALFEAHYEVYYISIEPISRPRTRKVEEVNLFMTGRHLGGCLEKIEEYWKPKKKRNHDLGSDPGTGLYNPLDDYLTYEEKLPPWVFNEALNNKIRNLDPLVSLEDRLPAINRLNQFIKDRVTASIQSPRRYAAGTKMVVEADFVSRLLTQTNAVKGKKDLFNRKVNVTDRWNNRISAEAKDILSKLKVTDLLSQPSVLIAKRIGVDPEVISRIKLENVGFPASKLLGQVNKDA